jgi:hypothetical protein
MAISLLCILSGLCCIGLGVYFLSCLSYLDDIDKEIKKSHEEMVKADIVLKTIDDQLQQMDKPIRLMNKFFSKYLYYLHR